MSNIVLTVGTSLDKKSVLETQAQLTKISKEMQRDIQFSDLGKETKKYEQAAKQVMQVNRSLGVNFSDTFKQFNVDGFVRDLKSMGINVDHLSDKLEEMGYDGVRSLEKFTHAMKSSNVELVKTQGMLEKTASTLGKTFVWSMANRSIDVVTRSVQQAVGYTKDLDKSLTDINIVTDLTAQQMDKFAVSANKAAEALGQTTLDYTEAALLYLQQGRSMTETSELVEATLIGANITGEQTAEMSELLTAALNGYNLAAQDAMDVTDKFAKVGAGTGADFYELATAFSKTASMASVVGVTFDQLTAQIATISTVTREAPESIGTSLKTIYGRMTEMKAGNADEEGFTFGKAKEAFDKVKIPLEDATGQLRDMGEVIEEVGNKWKDFDRNTQVALANAMAGSRQANRLIALFQNWDMYEDALVMSTNSAGAALEQNEKYMDSLEAKTNALRASMEELWMTLLDSDALSTVIESLTALTKVLTTITDMLGGLGPILSIAGVALAKTFGTKMAYQGIDSMQAFSKEAKNVLGTVFVKDVDKAVDSMKSLNEGILAGTGSVEDFGKKFKIPAENLQQLGELSGSLKAQKMNLERLTGQQDIYEEERKSAEKTLQLRQDEFESVKNRVNVEVEGLRNTKEQRKALSEEIQFKEQILRFDSEHGQIKVQQAEKIRESIEKDKELQSKLDKDYQNQLSTIREMSKERSDANIAQNKAKAELKATEENITSVKRVQSEVSNDILIKEKATQQILDQSAKARKQSLNFAKSIAMLGVATQGIGLLKQLGGAISEVEDRGKNLTEVLTSGLGIAIGGFFGGPMGASIGASIGKWVGSLFDFKTPLEQAYKDAEDFNEKIKSLEQDSASAAAIDAEIANLKTLKNSIKIKEQEVALSKKIAETFPDMIKGYDLEGNAIVDLTLSYEELYKAKEKAYLESAQGVKGSKANEKTARENIKSNLGSEGYNPTEDVSILINPIATELLKDTSKETQDLVLSLVDYENIAKQIKDGKSMEEIGAQLKTFVDNALGLEDVIRNINKLPSDVKSVMENMLSMLKEEDKKTFINMLLFGEDGELDIDSLFSAFDELKLTSEELLTELGNTFTEYNLETIIQTFINSGLHALPEGVSSVTELTKQELDSSFLQVVEAIQNDGLNLREVLANIGISLAEDQLTLIDLIYGSSEQMSAKSLELQQQLLKDRREFEANYTSPFAFADAGEMDATIDRYQELYDTNSGLIELFNDAQTLEFKDGHVFSRGFSELIDGNIDSLEDAESHLTTINELFEDMSDKDLSEMLGADLASAVSTLLDVEIGTPFDNWSDAAKSALEEVSNGFSAFETDMKNMYLSLKAEDTDFYKELIDNNGEEFLIWEERLGRKASEFQNLNEFMMETEFYRAQIVNDLHEGELINFWKFMEQEGLINAEALEGITNNEKKALLEMDEAQRQALIQKIDYRIEELKAKQKADEAAIDSTKTSALRELEVAAGLGSGAIDIYNQVSSKTAESFDNTYNTMAGLPGVFSLGAAYTRGTSIVDASVTASKDLITSVSSDIQNEINALEDAKKLIEGLSGFNPSDFDFSLDAYNPTGSTTTKPGGYKPSTDKGGKDKTEKEIEDLEFKKDIYHDINIELQKTEKLLTEIQGIEDLLYGPGKLENLSAQADVMRKQKELTEQKLALARQEAAMTREALSKEGVKFDSSGTVTNYNEILEQKTNWANSLSGDAKKQAQEYVKSLKSAIESYESLQFGVILDYENEIEEMRQAIQDKIIQAIEYEYEFNIEASVRFKEDVDFFDKFLEGFEEMPDKIDRSIEAFNKQYDSLEAFSKRYNDIINNSELDPMKKAEALEALKEDFKDVMLDLKSIYDAINKYILDTIQKNVDAVNSHVKAFKEINDEMADLLSMYELLGEGMNYDALNEVLGVQAESNEAQIDTLKRAQKEMEAFRDSLEEGSEEWEKANEAVKEMDKDIRKLALETVKIYQQQLENSFKKSINEINKALSGGLGLDKLEKEIEKTRKEQDKYYDSVEKTLWASKMQKQIQEEINKATDPKKREQLQKFYDQEIETLLQKEKLTAAEVERAEILYDIALKQMALDEARANKTIMRLVRDESGNWAYQYMTDMTAVQAAQDSLSNSLDKLMEHDKKVYRDTQDEILDRRKQFIADMQDLFTAYKNGEIKDEEEFNRLLGELQNEFNLDMLQLNSEFADAERNLAESTLMSIMDAYNITYGDLANLTEEQKQMFENAGITLGDSWESTIDNMVAKNDDFLAELIKQFDEPGGVQDIINTAIDNIKDSMDDYGDKVKEVAKQAGMDMGSMKDRIDQAKDSTEKLKTETDKLIESMKNEFKEITNNILPAYDKIKDKFKELQKEVQNYIKEIENAIQKQKDLASKPSTATPGGGGGSSNNGGGGNTGGGGGGSQPSRSPGVGDIVRSVPGTWYSDSYSGAPTGTPSKWAKEFKVTSHKTDGRPRPYHIAGTNGGTGSGWVEWVGFKTGGYTGDWSKTDGMDADGGKLALLHQKEMVLNAEDTKNILDAVSLVRDYAQTLKFQGENVPSQSDSSVVQNIEINADFSGVKNSNEIEQAFDNLVNRAAQYARQLK